MQRYLQYDRLQELNMTHFDCWASRLGETVTALELAPDVYKRQGVDYDGLRDAALCRAKADWLVAVSYTHLDVYKRQGVISSIILTARFIFSCLF